MDFKIKNFDIDLRTEFSILENDFGHDCLLVRPSKMLCTCSAQEGQQAAPFCPKCLGTGRRIKLERIKAVSREALMVNATQVSTMFNQFGEMYTNTRVYYLNYKLVPPPDCYIYNVSWVDNKPKTIIAAYKMRYAEAIRGDNGRTEFYVCSGYRDTTSLTKREDALKYFKIY